MGRLRYQLLTAVAGTLAYGDQQAAPIAVLVVHEFVTDKTKDERHVQNTEDYRAFLHRVGARRPSDEELHTLLGPFMLPGAPLFRGVPALLIGKLVTNRRSLGA